LQGIPKETNVFLTKERRVEIRRVSEERRISHGRIWSSSHFPLKTTKNLQRQSRKKHFTLPFCPLRQSCTGRDQLISSKSTFADFVEEFPRETKYACQRRKQLLLLTGSKDTTS
jgi:hypothetical protein